MHEYWTNELFDKIVAPHAINDIACEELREIIVGTNNNNIYTPQTTLSKEEEEIEEETLIYNEIEEKMKMFPTKNFYVDIPFDKLDNKLTDKTDIVVKCDYKCYCYSECKRETEYFYISHPNITNRVIINHLIKHGYDPNCNHRNIEEIHQTENSDCQFELWLGS